MLTHIFKQSFDLGYLPSDWKTAIISPIYKGGLKHLPNSFRPISLTCICCKVLERIIKTNLTHYLESNKLFTNEQHGFRGSHSRLTNFLLSFESCIEEMDEQKQVDVVYIDFKQAFDLVPHRRFLHKLSMYGISGKLSHWIEQFVTGRIQGANVYGSLSTWWRVRSGVPQGSVLGLLLFLLYVNDHPSIINCESLMFADDLKMWKSINSPEYCLCFQENLDAL